MLTLVYIGCDVTLQEIEDEEFVSSALNEEGGGRKRAPRGKYKPRDVSKRRRDGDDAFDLAGEAETDSLTGRPLRGRGSRGPRGRVGLIAMQ